jgi:radical SAM superfamily enzyme YgiQ (UPF0313 family)
MGLLYLAAYVRERFPVEIRVVNQRMEGCSNEALAKMALDFEADVVGLGCITPSSQGMPIVARAIRAASPDTKIIIGGPHVSAFGPVVMEDIPADAAFIGEGEISLAMYLDALLGNGNLDAIPGLAWRNASGEITVNPGNVPIVEDLDSLPMPAYDLIDLPKYWHVQSIAPIPRRRYVSMVTSRGCPYGCMWCHNIFGRGFRAHSPERVVDEIRLYTERYHINDIEFLDDCFNLKRNRVTEVADLLRKKDIRIRIAFPNGVRADLLDEETMDALAESGMYFCSFALESASPRIQKLTRKNLNLEKFLHAVELAAAKRIFTNGFMMLGFPEETEEEMRATIHMATESRLHTASFYTVTPFPGTPLYDYALEHYPDKLTAVNYSNMDFCAMRANLSAVSDDLLYYYQRKANRTFFLKPDRLYRILRDYPQRHLLPLYLPIVADRMFKGLFS